MQVVGLDSEFWKQEDLLLAWCYHCCHPGLLRVREEEWKEDTLYVC